MQKNNTSWDNVANWYDNLIKNDNSYQNKVILPNILRLLDIRPGNEILDLGCGTGFFANEFQKNGAKVIGVDIGKELIDIAKKNYKDIKFIVSDSSNLKFIDDNSIDKITIILALQNIENIKDTINECYRILKNNGMLFIVLNHPVLRIPKKTSWIIEKNNISRRIDQYLTESKIKIEMHPGLKNNKYTVSFHRPLQTYFKILDNSGFYIKRLEEWTSHKISQNGPKKEIEDKARKEFPLFLMIEAIKLPNIKEK